MNRIRAAVGALALCALVAVGVHFWQQSNTTRAIERTAVEQYARSASGGAAVSAGSINYGGCALVNLIHDQKLVHVLLVESNAQWHLTRISTDRDNFDTDDIAGLEDCRLRATAT